MASALGRSSANPGRSCLHLKQESPLLTDGTYWLDPDGNGGFEAYCDMTGGGWTLVARFTVASAQAHYTRAAVGLVGTQGLDPDSATAQKYTDDRINALRVNSPYTGTTAFKMVCWEGESYVQDMHCSSACSFNATASIGANACALCSDTFQGSLVQLSPNTGTRGMGHHHDATYSWTMAYLRHPEQSTNAGCQNDARGSGDGTLWVR